MPSGPEVGVEEVGQYECQDVEINVVYTPRRLQWISSTEKITESESSNVFLTNELYMFCENSDKKRVSPFVVALLSFGV